MVFHLYFSGMWVSILIIQGCQVYKATAHHTNGPQEEASKSMVSLPAPDAPHEGEMRLILIVNLL